MSQSNNLDRPIRETQERDSRPLCDSCDNLLAACKIEVAYFDFLEDVLHIKHKYPELKAAIAKAEGQQ